MGLLISLDRFCLTKGTRIAIILVGIMGILSIIFSPLGLGFLLLGLILKKTNCPDCKNEVYILRGAIVYICTYCQAPVAKRNNRFRLAE